jgi:hypothetical protein
MGVDHFEMYNFALPMRDDGIEISRRFIRPLPGDDRLYTVTQDEGWYEDFCQYPKDLPGELTSGQPVTCRLLVGEDIATLVPQPKHVGIRLGFNGLTPGAQIRVRLNGQTVFEGAANDALRTAAKPVYGFFHIPVPDRRLLRKGDNLIETTLLDQKSGKVTLVEAVLAVLF